MTLTTLPSTAIVLPVVWLSPPRRPTVSVAGKIKIFDGVRRTLERLQDISQPQQTQNLAHFRLHGRQLDVAAVAPDALDLADEDTPTRGADVSHSPQIH